MDRDKKEQKDNKWTKTKRDKTGQGQEKTKKDTNGQGQTRTNKDCQVLQLFVPMCISACVNVNICACEHVSRLLYLDISARIHVCMCASCLFVSVCLCSVPLLFFVAGFVSLGPSLFLSVKQTEKNRDRTRHVRHQSKKRTNKARQTETKRDL